MQITSRVMRLTTVLLVAVLGFSCNTLQKNSNRANSNSNPPKLARWVAQYRSPLSEGFEGNALAENF